MKRCPQCGANYDDNVKFCPRDGAVPVPIALDTGERDPMIGVVLGNKYRIEKKIGEGGMGKIYLARHTGLGKRYAVKMLSSEYSTNQEAIERFRREAITAGEIEHPNIINVTDIDYTPDGQAYIVMEFLDGRELRQVLRETPVVPPSRALKILYQVARALDAAHLKGIIHRDLKPENIFLIDRADQKDVVKILDFGISKIKGSSGTHLTQTGMVIGTPHYMAPEQAKGDKNIDHRVDIYALGSIAYEMLTGTLPVDGDSPTAILMKIILEEPQPPNFVNPNLPSEASEVIKKAMAKKPEERFSTCLEFIEALMQSFQTSSASIRTSTFPDALGGTHQQYREQQSSTTTGFTPMQWQGTQAGVPAATPRKSISPAVIVVPLVVMFALAIVASVFLVFFKKGDGKSQPAAASGGSKPTLTTEKPVIEKREEESEETASDEEAVKSREEVTINFITDPDGATVFQKIGAVQRQLCQTECEYKFRKSDKKLRIIFSKGGYHDEEIEIAPKVEYQTIKVNLTRKSKRRKKGYKSSNIKIISGGSSREGGRVKPPVIRPIESSPNTSSKSSPAGQPKTRKKKPVIRIIR